MKPIKGARNSLAALITALVLCASPAAFAAEPECRLMLRNHQFEPAELRVPAGRKIRLLVTNTDPTPEEFESHVLNREKVIPGGSTGTLYIGPLAPGRYPYFGEFHEKTARGVIVAE